MISYLSSYFFVLFWKALAERTNLGSADFYANVSIALTRFGCIFGSLLLNISIFYYIVNVKTEATNVMRENITISLTPT